MKLAVSVVVAFLSANVVFCLPAQAQIPSLTINCWPQFRGPNSAGIGSGSPPVEFGPGKNELWRVEMGAGHSSPCIVGNTIFLTTYDEPRNQLSVVCLDRTTGDTRWRKDVSSESIEKGHPSFNPASSTPTCDGERVVAYFGSVGLICLDMQGRQLWDLKMPTATSYGGNATSPVIIGDRVILYRGTYQDHFLLAVDKRSGNELWKVPQDEPFTAEMACTACPIVAAGKLIVHTARSVQAFDPENGKLIWIAKCATTATSTPIINHGNVIVAAWNKLGEPDLRPAIPGFAELLKSSDKDGDKLISPAEFPKLWIFHRPEGIEAPSNGATIRFGKADRNQDQTISAEEWSACVDSVEKYRAGYETHGLISIPVNSQGQVPVENVRLLETQGIPEVPSPICADGKVYLVKNGGVLTCLDLTTGDRIYRMRTGGSGTHYASPVIADGKLFTVSGSGKLSVLTLGENPTLLATNEMLDEVYATPAIIDGTIYVRTHSAFYAFGKETK